MTRVASTLSANSSAVRSSRNTLDTKLTYPDDVIERLKPTLGRHTNCDVIDLNPGVGVWSHKLHEVLKPRTHILLEPDEKLYRPYLEPLLDAPGSTYKLIPKSGILWSTLESLKTDGHLPHQEILPLGDPRLQENNDTLLFVANLGFWPGKAYLGFPSVALLMIHQLTAAARDNTLFHRYGHIRMLIWLSDGEKAVLLPRSVASRKKFTLEAEWTFERLTEVAGVDASAGRGSRDRTLELESTRRVLAKMKDGGITTPPNRVGKDELELQASDANDTAQLEAVSEGVLRKYNAELLQLQADYKAGLFVAKRDGKITPQYTRMKSLQHRKTMYSRKADRADKAVQLHYDIWEDEESLNPDAEDYKDQKERIETRWEELADILDALPPPDEKSVYSKIDERKVFGNDPPTLVWDQRPYEPLKVHANEFYPMQEMALFDLQPGPVWPILAKDHSAYDVLEFMATHLSTSSSQSIVRGLNSLAPGAVEWIIPRCPSLTDPKRGGSTDPKKMAVRTLTQQHWKELFEAWMDWPFKPTKGEMMAKMGSQYLSDDPDADEGSVGGIFTP